MIILPAIDLKNGMCVRMLKGDFATVGKVADDAVEAGIRFKASGATWLHMVDLDGAREGGRLNRGLILKTVKATGLKAEVGGGIRDLKSIEDYISNGISRVILGSAAFYDMRFVKEAVQIYGDQVAVSIDAKDGFVATHGWINTSIENYLDFAKRMESIGVKIIIFTDINSDGTLEGPNYSQLEALQNTVSCRIIASGGIRNIENINRLASMGLYGAICGKSIYSGTLDLGAAIEAGGYQDAC